MLPPEFRIDIYRTIFLLGAPQHSVTGNFVRKSSKTKESEKNEQGIHSKVGFSERLFISIADRRWLRWRGSIKLQLVFFQLILLQLVFIHIVVKLDFFQFVFV